ncbi:hypothetical protein GW17_00015111 [Ensete ventricosum]|nr:hypothetical protein GW17_00015111 [Ensete ventricosum]
MSTSQSLKERDVELGSLRSDNTSDYGMEEFLKQVILLFMYSELPNQLFIFLFYFSSTLLIISSLQVATAMNYVQSGNDELLTAKSLSKRSRKCMFIAIVILLGIAAVIVLSILKPWK